MTDHPIIHLSDLDCSNVEAFREAVGASIQCGPMPKAARKAFDVANERLAAALAAGDDQDVIEDEFTGLEFDGRTRPVTREAIAQVRNLRALAGALEIKAAMADEASQQKIEAELAATQAKVGRLMAIVDRERYEQTPLPRKVRPEPLPAPGAYGAAPRSQATGSVPAIVAGGTRDIFAGFPRSRDGFRSLGDFVRAGLGATIDPRMGQVMAADHQEDVGSDGGFFVPSELTAGIIASSLESEIVRPRAFVVPMRSRDISLPWFDDTNRSSGATPQWLGELETGTRQVEPAAMVTLRAAKLAVYGAASLELLQDAPLFDGALQAQLAQRLGFALDAAFIGGNGVGKPLGIIHAGCTIAQAAEGGQAADTIVTANILKMLSRLLPSCWANAVWLAHPSTLPQLLNLQVVVSNRANTENVGGSATPLFTESNGTFRLAGKEVILTEHCSALGDVGDIVLADMSKYLVGMRLVASFERNQVFGWTSYATDFRMVYRVDGRPAWATPVTPASGPTLSCFVTLQSR